MLFTNVDNVLFFDHSQGHTAKRKDGLITSLPEPKPTVT
jgi:hypothetical protein